MNILKKVIVLQTNQGDFISGVTSNINEMTDYMWESIEVEENIKFAHDFNSVEDAELALSKISSIWGASVKRFKYEIDKAFLEFPENITEL